MRLRDMFAATLVVLCGGLLQSGTARADTVLYDSANFIQGNQSFTQGFTLTTSGTLTVSLENVPWLDTIANLSCFVTSGSSVVAPVMGVGTESMSLAAGTYYAHWFGDANGQYGLGVSDLKVMFQPTSGATVPLPGTFLLLVCGLGLLFGWQHRDSSRSHSPAGMLLGGSPQEDLSA